ncbi:hypothetical protein SAMN02799636_01698 [Methylobacterium sp. 275MFSha3.1]|nr:hypothetical protein SAMN02799636_01698 [Methylobacterium sp. 275MFSha3.1]
MAGHAFDHMTLEERRDRLDAQAAVIANQQAARRFALQIAPADRAAAECLPREERLRSTAGLRGSPIMPLSAWRGRSGRRYVVRVLPVPAGDAEELCDAVVMLVGRDDSGLAEIRGVSIVRGLASAQALIDGLPPAVTELHAHRLAQTDADRAAILADLGTVTTGRRR